MEISCAEKLAKLRQEMGLEEHYVDKVAAYEADTSNVSISNVYGEKPSIYIGDNPKKGKKNIKKLEKETRRWRNKRSKELAKAKKIEEDAIQAQKTLWVLDEYFTPMVSQRIRDRYLELDTLVEYCVGLYDEIQQLNQLPESIPLSSKKAAKRLMKHQAQYDDLYDNAEDDCYLEGYDIPHYLTKQYSHYCKKHPITEEFGIVDRRTKFFKSLKKKDTKMKKKLKRSLKNELSPAAMKSNLKKIVEENGLKMKEFSDMVKHMTGDTSLNNHKLVKSFNEHTKRVQKSVEAKLKHLKKHKTKLIVEV